jgi:two-component system sensor histidine kinase SenX3
MAWLSRVRREEPQKSGVTGGEPLPSAIIDLLGSVDAESLILAPGESIIYSSPGIASYNLTRDHFLLNKSLLTLARAVRRSGLQQEATLELPRGPIGDGTHDLLVRVAPIGDEGLIAILIFDDSEMRRLDAIRRDFVANISHELKTPIGALSILSEAVLGAADDPDAITRFANRMQTEAHRLTDLVQEIIDLSRLQDGDPLKSGEIVDLVAATKEAAEQTSLSSETRKIDVVLSLPDRVEITGSREQVIMAIHNLIENAINYSPVGTRVAVALRVSDAIAELSVSDQGIGIPESSLERIFERFYRVDAARSRATGGTGLGLSIVKHVATNHGGDVSVWSVEGAGSTFTIRFPLTQQDNQPTLKAVEAQ